jgi:hypothetical protein
MGPLGIELRNEGIKLRLLLQEVGTCRFCRLLLQRQVHAFMTAILLRVTRLDPLNANPQPQPPH